MTDFPARRLAMVESQLRPNQVTGRRLLTAMATLPRERFVPPKLREFAYMDEAIQVFPSIDGAPARFLLAPMVQARLIQLAAVEPGDDVLDVGCATGYSTSVLSSLARQVTGLEPEPELAAAAREALRDLGVVNAEIVEGPLDRGHPAGAPYDVILVNGAVREPPDTLFQQLKPGGRLAVVLLSGANSGTQGKAFLFVRIGDEASGRPHFDAGAKLLPGFLPPADFVL